MMHLHFPEPNRNNSIQTALLTNYAVKTTALAELGEASLLNRIESKYLLTRKQLENILEDLLADYLVLDAYGTENPYQSVYFDTSDFVLYRRHHAGAKGRYKLRSRRYCASDTSFFEVKFKDNHDKTFKQRLSTQDLVKSIETVSDFVEERYPQTLDDLSPVLESRYTRITLVNPSGDERVTLDTELRFSAEGRSVNFPELVVAEVKRENHQVGSHFMQSMRAQHILPQSLSKYCLGVSQLYPVKANRFKPTLQHLKTLTKVNYA